jgi:glycerophosphoryl diester phosphodiesterase
MSPAALTIPGRPRPWIMAHRGASDLAPENSITAFTLAVEHGADLVETDLWISADGEIVCHHDPTLRRMFGDPRRVDAMTAADLGRLRMIGGHGDEPLPTLDALLSVLPEHVVPMLELKDPRFAETPRIRRLVEQLGDRVPQRRVGVITEHLRLLRTVKRTAPQLVVGYIALLRPCGPSWPELLGPYWPILRLNPFYVALAHRRGQRVCPLDPGLHDRLARYLALDVDALLTNDPRATRARVEALRPT